MGSCTEPTQAALAAVSDFDLTLSPNPATAGSEATLSVEYDGPGEAAGGAGALWECWTGEEWEPTHQILRDWAGGSGSPYIEPGTTPTIPAVGLMVPNSHNVAIPDVKPGVYRIRDEIWVAGEGLTGLAIVRVE